MKKHKNHSKGLVVYKFSIPALHSMFSPRPFVRTNSQGLYCFYVHNFLHVVNFKKFYLCIFSFCYITYKIQHLTDTIYNTRSLKDGKEKPEFSCSLPNRRNKTLSSSSRLSLWPGHMPHPSLSHRVICINHSLLCFIALLLFSCTFELCYFGQPVFDF